MNRKTILTLIFLSGLNAQISRYDAKPTLAVFNFESKALSDENATLMLDSLIYELYKTNAFIMVEEHQINEIILEQKYDHVSRKGSEIFVEELIFSPEKARMLGVEEGPKFGELASGESVEVKGKILNPEEVQEIKNKRYKLS